MCWIRTRVQLSTARENSAVGKLNDSFWSFSFARCFWLSKVIKLVSKWLPRWFLSTKIGKICPGHGPWIADIVSIFNTLRTVASGCKNPLLNLLKNSGLTHSWDLSIFGLQGKQIFFETWFLPSEVQWSNLKIDRFEPTRNINYDWKLSSLLSWPLKHVDVEGVCCLLGQRLGVGWDKNSLAQPAYSYQVVTQPTLNRLAQQIIINLTGLQPFKGQYKARVK